MKNLPTDLEILEDIYNRYYDDFASYQKGKSNRRTKIKMPIDIYSIAQKFNVDADIIFGRLYYHLNKKYGYTNNDGTKVNIYSTTKLDGHSVNFPLLASVLADLKDENKKFKIATGIAIFSLFISVCSLLISIFYS